MWSRLAQILGLLLCLLGWVLVGCTPAMSHWRVAQLGGQGGSSVVVTAWYWSDLWKDCYEDSTAVVNCIDFGVLWEVKSYIQAVRGLLLSGLCLGLVGAVLSFFGMECTNIGGDPRSKNRILIAASAFQMAGCLSDVAGYCLYINTVTSAFLHSKADPAKLRYNIGPPLYLGLVGDFLIALGCAAHCAAACRATHGKRPTRAPSLLRENRAKALLPGAKHVYGPPTRMLTGQNYLKDKMRSTLLVFGADPAFTMKYQTVVMYVEIGCFVSCLCGWILVCSTLPTEYWTFSEVGSIVLTTSNYYSNLWRDCISDTTGVSDCKDYPSMLALPVFLHACRALAVCAVITGFFGSVLTLIGMKCTKIGGTEIINARVTFSGGVTYLVSGFCGMITYSWWANKVVSEFVDPNFKAQKFELGAALFVGWGGSILLICGGVVLTYFSGKEGLQSSSPKKPKGPVSYATARTRRTYMQPPSRVTLVPPLYYAGRRTRTPGATTKTSRTYSQDTFV